MLSLTIRFGAFALRFLAGVGSGHGAIMKTRVALMLVSRVQQGLPSVIRRLCGELRAGLEKGVHVSADGLTV